MMYPPRILWWLGYLDYIPYRLLVTADSLSHGSYWMPDPCLPSRKNKNSVSIGFYEIFRGKR